MYALKVFDKIISLQKFYLPIRGNSKSVRVNTATKSYRLKKKKLVQLSIVQKLTFQTDISCPSEALYFTICSFVIKVTTILYIKAKSMFKTFLRSNLFRLKLSSGKKYLRFSKLIFVKVEQIFP